MDYNLDSNAIKGGSKFKKFTNEEAETDIDDLEKGTEDTKSQSDQPQEEVKVTSSPGIKVMLLTGTTKEMNCDLDTTKIKDVITKLFEDEVKAGKKVKLLFAGKVLNEDNTLTNCKYECFSFVCPVTSTFIGNVKDGY